MTTSSRVTLKPGDTIGIVGGGQLGRMLAMAAARLGLRCRVFSPDPDSPAFDVVANASLRYTYSQGFVVGEAGAQNTQTVAATITAEPIRSLLLSLVLGASKYDNISGRTTPNVTTYGVALSATYQILKWLSARASYTFYYQEQSGGNIPHNVLSLGLEASYPIRVDQ